MVNHLLESNVAGPTEVWKAAKWNSRSGAIPPARPVEFMTPYTNEHASRSDKIMAMEQLAADTGGKAFYNTNDPERRDGSCHSERRALLARWFTRRLIRRWMGPTGASR